MHGAASEEEHEWKLSQDRSDHVDGLDMYQLISVEALVRRLECFRMPLLYRTPLRMSLTVTQKLIPVERLVCRMLQRQTSSPVGRVESAKGVSERMTTYQIFFETRNVRIV